ncbi:MAG TPA: hypothetical protein ENJ95_17440 [Bacteroidetes bacterium]|nr:hypothetical protein [Bacteroidota bacterium]
MEAQQIKLDINKVVEGIHDEAFLKACFEAVQGIAKAYRRVVGTPQKPVVENKKGQETASPKTPAEGTENPEGEKAMPHDLSLVLLANEMFKGCGPLPEEGEIAFERAFKKSLKKQPTLPNRL